MAKDFKLPKKAKNAWVKALRSGKYEQTTEALKDSEGYCCLGVAREIGLVCRHRPGMEMLPYSFIPEYIQDLLVDMNDKESKSFAEIADWIEGTL